ncbi:MAG: peptidoglycan-binding protein [Propionibacteriaceae bacterium]|nr:peptidoglycan-binding protein [Propionibacteriaceae bacterium]
MALALVVALGVVTAGVAGVAGGMFLERTNWAEPVAFADGRPPSSAPVASRAYTDPRQVSVAFTRSAQEPVRSPVAGRVTSTACQPGQDLVTGAAFLTVDGANVVALHTRVPLWRGLEIGMVGDDVTALQEALVSLGHGVAVTGKYDRATREALRAVFRATGMSLKSSDGLPFDRIVWLPEDRVAVATCDVVLGEQIGVDQVLATPPLVLTRIEVVNPPGDRMPGPRSLKAGTFVVATLDDGVVTDPAQLADVTALRDYQFGVALSEDLVVTMDMEWSLQQSLEVSSVPPRAVFGQAGDQACVIADGRAWPVRVVASSLGSVLVEFGPDVAPPSSVDLEPGGQTCASH